MTGANLYGDNPGGPYYNGEANLGKANFVGASVIPTYMCPSDSSSAQSGSAFVNPIDPTLNPGDAGDTFAPTNYACNAMVFGLPYNFGPGYAFTDGNGIVYPPCGSALSLTQIKDGTSNTIFFGERLQFCDGTNPGANPGLGATRGTFWDWSEPVGQSGNSQNPFFSTYWETGVYQIRPTPGFCDYQLLNSPHTGSMNVCMGDASVRTLSAGMSLANWLAICTPRKGDQAPGDF
jgi:hypothetical protein